MSVVKLGVTRITSKVSQVEATWTLCTALTSDLAVGRSERKLCV